LFNALKKLKEQGMTLKQIAEVIGKTEGYVKNLFVGINEISQDKDLQNLIGHAGVTILDIAETKAVKDKGQRIELLKERKTGNVNRAEMREKVKELAVPKPDKKKPVAPIPERKKPDAPKASKKPQTIHISIMAYPGMNKIVIFQEKSGSAAQLKSLENDLRAYFTAKEEYRIEKAMQGKEKII
jgi:transcriptional regulator with XRE-family HTH domain